MLGLPGLLVDDPPDVLSGVSGDLHDVDLLHALTVGLPDGFHQLFTAFVDSGFGPPERAGGISECVLHDREYAERKGGHTSRLPAFATQ